MGRKKKLYGSPTTKMFRDFPHKKSCKSLRDHFYMCWCPVCGEHGDLGTLEDAGFVWYLCAHCANEHMKVSPLSTYKPYGELHHE